MAELATVIEWNAASRPLRGEAVSGDLEVVVATGRGALIGVVDGLGHGESARAAARVAVDAIGRHAEEPLATVVKRCHDALARTRGGVIGLASILSREGRMEWLGVGNVEGAVVRWDARATPRVVSLNSRGGLLGQTLPTLRVVEVPIVPGDTIVLVSDGVRPGYALEVSPVVPVDRVAKAVLAGWAKETDDALVLVARFLGGADDNRAE